MFRNLGYGAYFARAVNATAAGITTVNGSSYDLVATAGGPYDAVMAKAHLGALTATQQTVLKLQVSNDNSTWTDLAGSHQGPPADADGNKMLITDVYRILGYRYVRPVVVRATANAAIDSVDVTLYHAHSTPLTAQDSTVSTPTSSGGSSSPAPVNVIFDATAGTA